MAKLGHIHPKLARPRGSPRLTLPSVVRKPTPTFPLKCELTKVFIPKIPPEQISLFFPRSLS